MQLLFGLIHVYLNERFPAFFLITFTEMLHSCLPGIYARCNHRVKVEREAYLSTEVYIHRTQKGNPVQVVFTECPVCDTS